MPHYEKHITYCAETHDYMLGLSIDGAAPELVGYAKTIHAGETILSDLVMRLSPPPTAESSIDEDILMWSRAYLAAKQAGRTEAAAEYRARGLELIELRKQLAQAVEQAA